MKTIIQTAIITLLFSGCASFSISKESLVSQLKDNQKVDNQRNFNSMGLSFYSNNLTRIKCVDKDGQNVWLESGKNMNFRITKLSDQKTISMYFDTVILQNDTLYGLKSRIVGGKRKIPLSDVAKVEIHVEEPNTQIAH